jgi:DNA-binding SARP family transcriptional activator
VWGDDPPNRARNVLSAYVSRLRRIFGAVTDEVERPLLVRRSGGYVLELDPERVDLHLFRHMVIRSQEADDMQAAALISNMPRHASRVGDNKLQQSTILTPQGKPDFGVDLIAVVIP